MRQIVTLTLNLTIDSACMAKEVFPTHRVRAFNKRYGLAHEARL